MGEALMAFGGSVAVMGLIVAITLVILGRDDDDKWVS